LSSEYTVAAVSFLNARPLIEGLDSENGIRLISDVPSRLLETLLEDRASVALCPVIDFQLSPIELKIVPVGAIGCDGPALTVKLFSRVPMAELDDIAVDGESHTSVALLRIVMLELFGRDPSIHPLPGDRATRSRPDAMLLIGDKVVAAAPNRAIYPHELDLGAAWRMLADTPFVFATWMTRPGTDLGALPRRLRELRRRNLGRLTEIAVGHAQTGGWPVDLAVRYLGHTLRYDLGPAELEGVSEFWRRCHRHGVIGGVRPLTLYPGDE